MLCGACRTDNPPQNRFCDQCGASLEAVCSSCGARIRPEARFCGTCGKRLGEAVTSERQVELQAQPARPETSPTHRSPVASYTPRHLADKILRSRSAIEGERRQVTVLFADIAGFTTLAEKLDPEDVHRIMDRCFELITAEVHRFEGTINQYTGDGVMALFGAPIAHEDSPRRAAHAALAIQRALRDYDREGQAEGGLPLQMRIGCTRGRSSWERSATISEWITPRLATPPTWPRVYSKRPGPAAWWSARLRRARSRPSSRRWIWANWR
jgi:hypothetical protein